MITSSPIDLKQYIDENYHIIYKSEGVENVCDAKEFFLCENHSNLNLISANADFINKFKTKNSILFVEGVPSLEKVDKEMSWNFKNIVSDDLYVVGWDLKDHEAYNFISTKLDIAQIAQNIISNAINESTSKIESILQNKLINKNENEYKLGHHIACARGSLLKKYYATLMYSNSILQSIFEERTNDMNKSVKGIEKLRLEFNLDGLVFFIAGTFHFQEHPYNKDKKEYSLKSFYDNLKNRKAVVLKSKFDSFAPSPILPIPFDYLKNCPSLPSGHIFVKIPAMPTIF